MRFAILAPAVAAALCAAAPVQAEDFNNLLRGTFAVTGSDACNVSFTGFAADAVAETPFFSQTSSDFGTTVFNGDGTGSSEVTAVTNGTVLTGVSAGDTFTVEGGPPGVGALSQDLRTVITGVTTPTEDTLTLSTGLVEHRLCTHTRVLVKINDRTDKQ